MTNYENLLREAYGNTDDVKFTCPYCKEKEDIESYRAGYEGAIEEDESVQDFLMRGGDSLACPLSKCFVCTTCYATLVQRNHSILFKDKENFTRDAFIVFRVDFEPLPNQDSKKLREAYEVINERPLPNIPKEEK